ncbi:hypothetical protein F5Y13DRAFT_167419 [Hypoxylon sp. FL1857]|nr:hypothetical protein F5Y13DRAFT_167419 [Hypoxylon sp. FL1857]
MASSQQDLTGVTTNEQEELQDKNHSGQRVTFFDLPAEVRLIIYRFLFVENKQNSMIFRSPLNDSILRTCRSILNEAQPILYEEYTWRIRIWGGYSEGYVNGMEAEEFRERLDVILDSPHKHPKRFYIVVEIQIEDDVSTVRRALTKVSKTLSDFPPLHYVHISLRQYSDGSGDAQEYCAALENFTLLQNVRHVEFDGVPPVYAKYLTDKMTGSAPLDHLPRMYDALVTYAGHFDDCEDLIQEACNAMEETNVDRFKDARNEAIARVNRYMTDAFDHLFDHDARL